MASSKESTPGRGSASLSSCTLSSSTVHAPHCANSRILARLEADEVALVATCGGLTSLDRVSVAIPDREAFLTAQMFLFLGMDAATPEDRLAMSRFVRAQLARVGVALPGDTESPSGR